MSAAGGRPYIDRMGENGTPPVRYLSLSLPRYPRPVCVYVCVRERERETNISRPHVLAERAPRKPSPILKQALSRRICRAQDG